MRKVFLILFISLFAKAWAYDAQINGIYYSFHGTTASVTSGDDKYAGEVVIPATVSYAGGTYSVTSIESYGFYDCTNLTKLVLPESITQIGTYAFAGCTTLTTMTIPDDVSTIEEGIFASCENLVTVKLPSRAYSINRAVFFGCRSLTSIELPINISSIEDYTFYGCSSLTNIYIPIWVESIGPSAFENCSSLRNIEISSYTESIGDGAFAGCNNLSSINVNEYNSYYTSADGILYNKDMSSLLAYPAGKENTSFVIPNSVTTIGNNAFELCKNLVNIDIPNSVTSIGQYAFSGCGNLANIDIPSSVTSIDKRAFSECKSLHSISVSADNTEYASADGILYSKDMSALLAYPAAKENTSFIIPNNVTTIGESAFSNCSNLTRVDIPTTTTNFAGIAFEYCDNIQSAYIYKDKDVLLAENSAIFEFTYDSGIEHILYVRKGMKELYEASVYKYIFTRIEEMTDEEAGIDNIDNGMKEATIKHIYGINGRKQNEMQNGINIIRYSDGSVRKVMKK